MRFDISSILLMVTLLSGCGKDEPKVATENVEVEKIEAAPKPQSIIDTSVERCRGLFAVASRDICLIRQAATEGMMLYLTRVSKDSQDEMERFCEPIEFDHGLLQELARQSSRYLETSASLSRSTPASSFIPADCEFAAKRLLEDEDLIARIRPLRTVNTNEATAVAEAASEPTQSPEPDTFFSDASAEQIRLAKDWQEKNSRCRGTEGANESSTICEQRDAAYDTMKAAGVCYGEGDQSGADARLHLCKLASW